jgi:hypothetical protein
MAERAEILNAMRIVGISQIYIYMVALSEKSYII